jgi:hypothetical protein
MLVELGGRERVVELMKVASNLKICHWDVYMYFGLNVTLLRAYRQQHPLDHATMQLLDGERRARSAISADSVGPSEL